MKKLILLLCLVFAVITVNAQESWKGFFKPVPNTLLMYTDANAKGLHTTWLFRPTVSITAMQFIPDKESVFIVNNLSSVGTGLSYNHYTLVEGIPYSDYGFNLLLLYNTSIGEDIPPLSLSVAATVTAFQLVNVGIGYSPELKKPFLLTGIAYSFNK